MRRSTFAAIFVLTLILALATTALADDSATILRRGFFTEITDTEASGYTIQSFRASADGSRIAYFVAEAYPDSSLWVIDGDGSDNVLIERTFEYGSLYDGHYDIADDGSTIVYLRLTSAGDPTPEITRFDVATQTKTTLLKQLEVTNYGYSETWYINPRRNNEGLFRVSGDGTSLFFLNSFGPVNGSGDISGSTFYRLATTSGVATPIFETKDIQSIAGIHPSANSFNLWEGEIDTDLTGSTLVVVATSSNPSTADTDIVVMGGDGSNATSILDVSDGKFHGPALSGDGSRLAFARGGTATVTTSGYFIADASVPASPTQLDPGSPYWSMNVALDSPAGFMAYSYDLGGGSSPSIRLVEVATGDRLPISLPAVEALLPRAAVVPGGGTLFLVGSTDRAGTGHREVIRFDLGTSPFIGTPRVAAASGSPSLHITSSSRYDSDYTTYTWFAEGTDLREMYSYPFSDDPRRLAYCRLDGFNDNGYLYDDGSSEGDPVAGDNQFTDSWVRVTYDAICSDPVLDRFLLRAAVATDTGEASFADFVIYIDPMFFADGFETGTTDAWSNLIE